MTAADDLWNAANSRKLDVGTADWVVKSTVGEDAIRPGELINWALRLRPDALREAAKDLYRVAQSDGSQSRYPGVGESTTSGTRISQLAECWSGDGAAAFENRWAGLVSYVGSGASSGRRSAVKAQYHAMMKLAIAYESLQKALTDSLTSGPLANFRKTYVSACCKAGDEGTDQILQDAGMGASFGAVGNAPGVAIGTILGAVHGMVTAPSSEQARADTLSDQADLIGQLVKAVNGTKPNFGRYEDDADQPLDYVEYQPNSNTLTGEWFVG